MGHVRDVIGEFESRNTKVLGVTAQDSEELRKYLEFHEFPFLIINDEDRSVIKAYGIDQETEGQFGTIAQPTNMILDAEGMVRYFYIGEGAADFPEDEDMYEMLDKI